MVVLLPGAVGADEAEDLALADRQVEVIDGDELAVPLGEVVDLDHGFAPLGAFGVGDCLGFRESGEAGSPPLTAELYRGESGLGKGAALRWATSRVNPRWRSTGGSIVWPGINLSTRPTRRISPKSSARSDTLDRISKALPTGAGSSASAFALSSPFGSKLVQLRAERDRSPGGERPEVDPFEFVGDGGRPRRPRRRCQVEPEVVPNRLGPSRRDLRMPGERDGARDARPSARPGTARGSGAGPWKSVRAGKGIVRKLDWITSSPSERPAGRQRKGQRGGVVGVGDREPDPARRVDRGEPAEMAAGIVAFVGLDHVDLVARRVVADVVGRGALDADGEGRSRAPGRRPRPIPGGRAGNGRPAS